MRAKVSMKTVVIAAVAAVAAGFFGFQLGKRLYCGEDAERAIETLLPVGSEDDLRFAQGWLTNRDHLVSSWCD